VSFEDEKSEDATERGGGETEPGGYVHRPGSADDADAESGASDTDAESRASDTDAESRASDTDGLGSRGWVLVAVLTVCTLVVPGIIYVRPGILSALGVPYIASLLVLPLLPAAALGLTAVWAMTAADGNE
jgi:hypothetical protein